MWAISDGEYDYEEDTETRVRKKNPGTTTFLQDSVPGARVYAVSSEQHCTTAY